MPVCSSKSRVKPSLPDLGTASGALRKPAPVCQSSAFAGEAAAKQKATHASHQTVSQGRLLGPHVSSLVSLMFPYHYRAKFPQATKISEPRMEHGLNTE